VEFKDEMLNRLYDAEFKEVCLFFFMLKEPKQKREIKAVLDQQLSPDMSSKQDIQIVLR